MEQLKDLIEKIITQAELTYDRLPDIDLYMDQVIEYLARQSFSQNENDKISSAMINNYIKDGLLPRANDKKYGKDHLAYLIMISRLKQTLSVRETGMLLKAETKDKMISSYYDEFQAIVADTAKVFESTLPDDEEKLSELAIRLAITGYVNKIACEMILSKLAQKYEEAQPDEMNQTENDEAKLEKAEKKDKNEQKKDKSSSKKEKK